MGRAELRRQTKSRKKEQEKVNKVLKNAGFPEFQLPPAPLKTTNLSDQEVANITGTKIAVLEQWRKEQTEEIRKACILEAQEKLDKAENFITLCNIITFLKSLEGFRYGRAAAEYMLSHYSESVVAWLPDFSTSGAVKKGEVEMNAAIALKASKAAGVFRNIKVK